MECQNCHKPLTDPRVCRHCGMEQSQPPAEPVPAVAPATPVLEMKNSPGQQQQVAAAAPPVSPPEPAPVPPPEPQEPAPAAAVLKEERRAAARARIEIRNKEKKKAKPPEPQQQPVPQGPEQKKPGPPPAQPPEPPPEPPPIAVPPPAPVPTAAPATPPEPPPAAPPPEPPPQPAPPEPRPPKAAPRPSPQPFVEITDSRLKQFNAVHGEGNILSSMYVSIGEEGETEEPTIFDCLIPLPVLGFADPGTTAFLADDLHKKAAAVKRDRLLLITSSNESFLRGAAAAVIETMGVPAAQRKLLNFMAPVARGFVPTIAHFLETRPDAEDEMLIVIDATSDSARQFVDSLFAMDGASLYGFIRDSLAAQHLSLICYMDSVHYSKLPSRELRRFPFECWNVSYLRYLLRPYYPQDYVRLEETILEQRKRGRWASSDFDFHEQIREQAEEGKLEDVIAGGGVAAGSAIPKSFPKASQPIHLAAVYTATFFENLTPADFDRVVVLLLGARTRLETVKAERTNQDGVTEQVDVQRERLLVDVWREDPDSFLTDCQLVPNKENNRAITFDVAGSRDLFRAHFESRYGLYVQNQFQTIVGNELYLDPSDRIAENTRLLIADMILGSPDPFSQRWLCELIASAGTKSRFEPAHTFRRLAQLLSDLWSSNRALVQGVLGELIETGLHDAAFEIIRNLRPKPELDDFAYVRQLLERGDRAVQEKISTALGRDLRNPGFWSVLRALESWLPAADRPLDRYSRANTQALRLVLKYFVEATTQLDIAQYGKWPAELPLLDVTSEEQARENFALLTRWLLHPGLGSVFDTPVPQETATRLVAALISEWAFILIGPTPASADPPSGFPAADALRVLLEQIVVRGGPSIHRGVLREMVDYWEELKDILLAVANVSDDNAVRREVQWKRQVVRWLLGHFREIARPRKTAAQLATA